MAKYVKIDDVIQAIAPFYSSYAWPRVRNLLEKLPSVVELQTARAIVKHSNECLPPEDILRKEFAEQLVKLAAESGCVRITEVTNGRDASMCIKTYCGELKFAFPEGVPIPK